MDKQLREIIHVGDPVKVVIDNTGTSHEALYSLGSVESANEATIDGINVYAEGASFICDTLIDKATMDIFLDAAFGYENNHIFIFEDGSYELGEYGDYPTDLVKNYYELYSSGSEGVWVYGRTPDGNVSGDELNQELSWNRAFTDEEWLELYGNTLDQEVTENTPLTKGSYTVTPIVKHLIIHPEEYDVSKIAERIDRITDSRVQIVITFDSILEKIEYSKWEPDFSTNITNSVFDVPITEGEYKTFSNEIYVTLLGESILLSSEYDSTGQKGTDYYFSLEGISEGNLTGNGKYRHLTIPTSLFANWLAENERSIKKVLQVNETLIGTLLITTMTFEYNPTIKTTKSEEEIE